MSTSSDILRALGLAPAEQPPGGVIGAPTGGSLYAPDPELIKREPSTTRDRQDITNTTLAAGNPVGSWQLPVRQVFRYLRVTSYYNGIFVLSTQRPPSQADVAAAAAGIANDPAAVDAVIRGGDQKILDFGDVGERNVFIQCQLIGGGLTLAAGGITLELDSEKFDVRTDSSGVLAAPATVPVPPLSGIEVPASIAAPFTAGLNNFAIPATATGLVAIIYGAVPARSPGTLSIIGDVSGAEYVPSQQQTFFNKTTVLMGVNPVDVNIAVTLVGPYTCHLYWVGPAYTQITAGTVNIGNTPAVTISGTPAVTISGTPTINIGNTPAVTINSGTINISGNVTVINSAGTNLQVAQSQVKLGTTINGTVQFTTDPRWHALGFIVTAGGAVTLSVKGHTTGAQYVPLPFQAFTSVTGQRFVLPLTPLSTDDALLDVLSNGTGMQVIAILDGGTSAEVFTGSGQLLNTVGDRTIALNGTGLVGGKGINIDLAPNVNVKGMAIWIQVTGGAGTSTVSVQARDPNTGLTINILTTTALGAGAGAFMRIYPGLTPAANAVASDLLGETARIVITFGVNTQATNLGLVADRM
jgi:hypothetical protein